MKKRFRRKKRGPVIAKKVTYDGITFASGLEKYMYIALRKAKIKAKYEGETYTIFEGFMFDNESYERQSNGKGDLVNRGSKKILGIKYTPDFISKEFIIECKGRANDTFPMRWKLFKKYGSTLNDERRLGMKNLQGYLKDVQEELMDAVLYIQAAREELRDLSEEALIQKFNDEETF